jgi:hypothetical protein
MYTDSGSGSHTRQVPSEMSQIASPATAHSSFTVRS